MTLIKSISGIRGTVGGGPGENFTPLDIVKFSAAYGAWLKERGNEKTVVVVGRDARISGGMVSSLVCATLNGMGIEVIDMGLSTTPSIEMAIVREKATGGIIITASHNPIQWNALKLFNQQGEFISGEAGKIILAKADQNDFLFAETLSLGKITQQTDSIEKHIEAVLAYPLVDKKAIQNAGLRVVVDAVNSTGGLAVPALLKALGVEVKAINCEPTGHFAHNPEPLPDHLGAIMTEVPKLQYDLGIVVDPDVDRLVLISEDGSPFGEEYTLVAVADYYLQHKPGSTVSNLSSSRALKDITEKHGQTYYASAVGEVNVVEKMKEKGATIGGEGNGGIIVSDFHYGRDALIGIALFLTHLVKSGVKCSKLRAGYPQYHISKNKIELDSQFDLDDILNKIAQKYSNYSVNREDGVRIDFESEWVHLRKSNTEPIVRIISESPSASTSETISKKFISDIRDIINDK
ncbi:MAG: phosphoglucosamine mutase [Cyclobacteriaceae bacterium]|nr:phosphoglucosamine mutase [Cyclobacteriaceae bacterium]